SEVAGLVPVIRAAFVPVRAPLPDVARHLIQAPRALSFRIPPHPTCVFVAAVLVVPALVRIPFLSPRIFPAIGSPCTFFPFQLRWEPQSRPFAVGLRIVPTHADNWMIGLRR